MALSPAQFPSTQDIEDFANSMGLSGVDADLFYEAYYRLNTDDEYEDEVEYRDELTQSNWEY